MTHMPLLKSPYLSTGLVMFSEMANSPEDKGNTCPYIWLTNGFKGKGTSTLYISWVFFVCF